MDWFLYDIGLRRERVKKEIPFCLDPDIQSLLKFCLADCVH